MVREFLELESLDSFVVTVVEVLCICADLPLVRLGDIGIFIGTIARTLSDGTAEFFSFLDCRFAPSAGGQVIS